MQRTRFTIWFNERSGSTHLSSLLNSHPKIACSREIFFRGEGLAEQDYFGQSGISDPREFLKAFFSYDWERLGKLVDDFHPESSPQAIGFKLKYQQVDNYPDLCECIFTTAGLRIIHLLRRNLLATLVSSKMVPRLLQVFQKPNIYVDAPPRSFDRLITLDPRTVLAELDYIQSRITRAREIAAGSTVLEIVYEDLVDHRAEVCGRTLDFLGIREKGELLSSQYLKIMPLSLKESIQNYDEIFQSLVGSRFEYLVDGALR